jgi:hypothetical protein
MAEPTSNLKYSDFAKAVARFLGHGYAIPTDADQLAEVDRYVQSGYKSFIWPDSGHRWSFLRKAATIAAAASDALYDLPDDYAGMATSRMTFADEGSWPPVELVSDEIMRQKTQERSTSTGRPCFASVHPKTRTSAAYSQRYELQLWPVPDVAYTLSYRYDVLVNALTYSAGPPVVDDYPLGGAMHAETIMASCLAAAEQSANDEVGLYTSKFAAKLAASIRRDMILGTPDILGSMNRNSDSVLNDREYRRTALVEYETE